jgi:ribonuclease HII
MSQLIAGVDEAGRGPVIGPLVIAGIVIKEAQQEALIEWGVRDSKQLTPRKRETLNQQIRQLASQVEVLEISAQEIDSQRRQKRTLNILEARWMAQILNQLQWHTAYIDASDVNANRYGRIIQSQLDTKGKVISEHKADIRYPVVAAASIIAKVRRDQQIKELHKRFGDFGSGYLTDPKTRQFLTNWINVHSTFPEVVRQTWIPARDLLSTKQQRSLQDWESAR